MWGLLGSAISLSLLSEGLYTTGGGGMPLLIKLLLRLLPLLLPLPDAGDALPEGGRCCLQIHMWRDLLASVGRLQRAGWVGRCCRGGGYGGCGGWRLICSVGVGTVGAKDRS